MSWLAEIDADADEDLYPDSDGKPMGETTWHILCLILLRQALEDLTQDQPDVCVENNMFFYYEEGNPKARKCPDGLVAKGVKKCLRRSFKTWVEKAVPCTVFEFISARTWKEDLVVKPKVYARLGIKEYFLFDPEDRRLKPRLQGYRLQRGKYVRLKPAADSSLVSEELQARLVPEGYMIRIIDLRTGRAVLTRKEQVEAAQAELARLRARAGNKISKA